jgi:hypothetical protein
VDDRRWGYLFRACRRAQVSVLFRFRHKKIRGLFKVEKGFDAGLSVSTDERWLLYSQVDQQNSDIMIVDHFR